MQTLVSTKVVRIYSLIKGRNVSSSELLTKTGWAVDQTYVGYEV